MKKLTPIIFLTLLAGPLAAQANTIKKIKSGDKNVLSRISLADFEKLHQYKGIDFYIPRRIGQKALRSLFGCLKNKNQKVRFYCAQYLYQLKLTYIHKKLILRYYKREDYLPAKMALQDILVLINEERFAKARKMGDASFLAKISFVEIADFVEKGFPEEGDEFTMKDLNFLMGGLKNRELKMQLFSVMMMGRIQKASEKVGRILKGYAKKNKNAKVQAEIKTSLKCIARPTDCPDAELNQYE